MKTITCIIADDEELAREIMQSHVAKLPFLKLVATCNNGMEVYQALKKETVGLLFLDIQMPQLTGIELLRTLKTCPPVIMTYEFNVVDYLLKPVSFERFLKAVEKFTAFNAPQAVPAEAHGQGLSDAFIYIKSNKKNVKVMLKDILYVEGLKDYVIIHTATGTHITYQTLTYLEEKLSADYFVRVHRSYIVSLGHVSAYTTTQIEVGQKHIPIGSSYAKELLKLLDGAK
jgi:DNA-binding LytR/AlgR family response regulator